MAENSRMGALRARVLRVRVMSQWSAVSSMVPSMGAPDQGTYLSLSGR